VQRETPRKPASPPAPQLRKVTHGSRVVDPASGLTKMDLVRYYVEVAPWLLPHLRGRPAYIRRAPMGIVGPMVFLQHPKDCAACVAPTRRCGPATIRPSPSTRWTISSPPRSSA
jgi:hypothetical protein